MLKFYRNALIAICLLTTQDALLAQMLTARVEGYDMHAELNWNSFGGADRYAIWKKSESESTFTLLTTTRRLRWIDWTGRQGEEPGIYQYYLEALSVPGALLARSDTLEAVVAPFSDDQFLDMVQSHTIRYFWEHGHPVSGMARERLGSGDVVTTGGTGFGIMAIITGVSRGWIDRSAATNRLLQLVSFLQFADSFHGVFPHWVNGQTGDALPFSQFDNGGDLVETAFLFQGLLCARTYFDLDNPAENALRSVISSLWENIDWQFYTRNNSGVLYWHWSPEFAWQMNFPIRGYNEAMMPYMLAIASPTHPIPASYWHSGWAGSGYVNGFSWYGHKLFVGPPLGGPLFFAHYSYQGFDPRNIRDAYCNYFEQNRNHTLVNRAWCTANPLHHEGYSDVSWGLTASDNPWGYFAHAPGGTTDNGTLTPTAALSSMPYTPAESMDALIHFYRTYGDRLWGEYGFYDAFNPGEDWVAGSYLAIDQGPIVNMIENHRSGLLWSLFMANPEIAPALQAIGFEPDVTGTRESRLPEPDWSVTPTVSDGWVTVRLGDFPGTGNWNLSVLNPDGRLLKTWSGLSDNQDLQVNLEPIAAATTLLYFVLEQPPQSRYFRQVIRK